ncbi:MAG: S-layer homology domain-containing protein [Selenomonadaceae bacterium]|nr:S-layer homology domain-containing protein [Selenomonadaceae bacterium]
MKKTLVSALTAALVVGAASTTFAAANPFSDVPAGHWAYDAVAQLAQDGVVEGYGDTTFQGDKNITRYEMAQMVARAMAKTNGGTTVSGADKAALDKLAAEFSDELNNLGVRVANLEKNADMVKWNGEMRVQANSVRNEGKHMTNSYPVKLRLEPTAEINSNWHVKGRIDANGSLNEDTTEQAKLQRVYAEGKYGNTTLDFGKVPTVFNTNMLFDGEFSGASVTTGNKLKATVLGGRWSQVKDTTDAAADVYGVGVKYATGKLSAGAAYHELKSDAFKTDTTTFPSYRSGSSKSDKAQIWSVDGFYRFDANTALGGEYAQNEKADAYDKSGTVEFDYKGAKKANVGTWGAYVAYRHLGQNVSLKPNTLNYAAMNGTKGWEIGADYALFKNTVAYVKYFDGEKLAGGKDASKLMGRLSFFF